MPAVLTHKAITLLARDRLVQIRDLTARMIERKTVAGVNIPRIEVRINQLADTAVRMMNTGPTADVTLARARDSGFSGEPDVFGSGISKFAILGSMGPDLPAFAEVFRPGQAWVFDTVHKGSPDYNREAVVAGTMDMALGFHLAALIKVRETINDADQPTRDRKREVEMQKVRAYTLGHFCHLAGDIIAHPLINDLEWHLGLPGAAHSTHGKNEAVFDAAVARRIFRRPSTREGQAWSAWWPTSDEVPDYFVDAYADAFKSTYGTDRPTGFKDFEADLARFGAPDLTADFMRSGVRTFRGLALTGGYDWGYGHWFGMLSLVTVPLMFAPLIAYAFPYARQFFVQPDDPALVSAEREAMELLSLPLQLGALPALIYGSVLSPFARGARGRNITGIVFSAVTLASMIGMAAESGAATRPGDGLPGWARWLLFFGPPLGVSVVFFGLTIKDETLDFAHPRPFIEEKPAARRQLLNFVNLVPLLVMAVFFVMLAMFLLWGELLKNPADRDQRSIDKPAFWLAFAAHALGMLALWLLLPPVFRDKKIPETVPNTAFALGKHAVRLFDDTTLFTDPGSAPDLPVRYFPSDIRPLARLWWTGPGSMRIRSDRFGLTFRHSAAAADQTVTGPIAPMTMAEYLLVLMDVVQDDTGTTGGLTGALFDPEAVAAYLLPSGATFAAFGELDRVDEADVIATSATFRDLGTAAGDSAFVLYHAPKPGQAVKAVPRGTIRPLTETSLRTAEAAVGYDYLFDTFVDDPTSSEALLAKAADLGALLCMGAADHMSAAPATDDRVYQIFRNWSLDRRRLNEWRMVVEGGALSDKGGAADAYDPAMPQGLHGPILPGSYRAPVATADPAVLAEAEQTARGNGWIKTMRDWIAAVAEGEDLLSTVPVRPGTPSNRALSRALAYMFDAPDPAGGP